MDEFINSLVSKVQAAGGTLNYRQMYEETAFQDRSKLPNALKQARAQGLLTQEVSVVDGAVVHVYKTVV
jgi:hypothetical protein